MKRVIKWAAFAFGILVLLGLISIAAICKRHHRSGMLASGGKISDNQASFDVTSYDINLKILADEEKIDGVTRVEIRSLRDSLARIQLQLVRSLTIDKISYMDHLLTFERKKNNLWIRLPSPLIKGEKIELSIKYRGSPVKAIKPPWIGGFNWSKDDGGNHWIGVSCQGEGAKIWFPCKDHPSDKPDSIALNITVPESYYCAGNGLLRQVKQPEPGWLTYCWKSFYPINNYNITINIAKYEILQRHYFCIDGSTMPVYFYTLPGFKPQADSLLDMAVDMLYTYRKFYGEYPFAKEKFALAQTAYLGMEHQTINSYGNNFRKTEIKGVVYDQLMLHEMAHEWWGNKVTAKSWSDFWLHEGIGTYGEALYLLDKGGESAYHAFFDRIRSRIRNRKSIVGTKNATSMQAYHSDIYYKGAYLLHTLRFVAGDSTLMKTLYAFVNDSAFTYDNMASTEDFINFFSDDNIADLLRFYLYTTELPIIQVKSINDTTFSVFTDNITFNMPVEINCSGGLITAILGAAPVRITSSTIPVIDPQNWYLKKIESD